VHAQAQNPISKVTHKTKITLQKSSTRKKSHVTHVLGAGSMLRHKQKISKSQHAMAILSHDTECFDFFFLTGRLGACAEARAQARRAEQESTFGPRGCRLLVGGPAQQATALPSKGPVWNQQIKLKLK